MEARAVEVPRHVAELDPDLRPAVLQRLARLHQEGHPVPSGVVDVQARGGEGGRDAPLGHRLVVEVARLGHPMAGAALVLPHHHVAHLDLPHGPEHLDLLVPDVIRAEADRRLHGKERHDLQQVVLHDVSDDAVVVEVPPAPLGPEVLTEDDLHAADVLAAPEGLEHEVGEAQHEEVLDQLLAQVVVDAVDLLLRQGLGEALGELLGRVGVPSKGLLDDDAGVPGGGLGRLGRARGRVHENRGRDGEVEDAVGGAPPLLHRHGLGELPEALHAVVPARLVEAAVQELPHPVIAVFLVRDAAGEALHDHLTELLVCELGPRIPEDREALGEHALVEEGEKGRKDLLLCQVT
mmetsp:Transcript_9702/g.31580  ORF Transcript_9702/g.31580 Transcript_9702/m.31580 type:complete len:350 (+) Transcript_9702:467-1516(+)